MHSTLVISVLVARTMQVVTVLHQNQVRAIYMILMAIVSVVNLVIILMTTNTYNSLQTIIMPSKTQIMHLTQV